MLQSINRLGKSWVGKVVVGILFGFLIVSFAIWGIGDIFRGGVRTSVATVGKTDISADAYRAAYQTEYQNLIRRTRQTITPEQARARGLERQVLARLVTETALDLRARDLGLAVPDALVAQAIQNDPSFHGTNGQFDRAQFTDLLRSSGLSEGQYVRDQKAIAARLQLAESITGALPVPLPLREAVHRFAEERRTIEYVALAPDAAGPPPSNPSDADLQGFFDERKALYRAPEYRALTILTLDAGRLAKPEGVSDSDARATYERSKEGRFGTPEKRSVQQIVFPSIEDANAASARIKAGASFDEVAKERGIDETALNLGTFAKSEMLDPVAGEAAFALAEGVVSEPVAGRFGPVLVRAAKVEPGAMKPFEEVAGEIRQDLARERARSEVQKVHDEIEDQRAAAKPLDAIAKERGLTLTRVADVDRQGRDKAGVAVAMPEPSAILPVAFRSEVGADTEAVRLAGDGYAWVEVTGVEPARDRAMAEVKERVAEDWRIEETSRRLSERARTLRERIDGGEPLAKVAGDAGLAVETAADLGRASVSGALTRPVLTRAFATPVGKAADIAVEGGTRVLFRVTAAAMPPFVTTTQQAARTDEQLRSTLAEDILSEYFAEVEKQIGVRTFPDAMRRAIGGDS